MVPQIRNSGGAHIACGAHFKRHVSLPQNLEQSGIVDRADAVADALRADFEGIPNACGVRYFPGVTGQSQTRLRSFTIELLKPGGWTAFFIPTDADRNHALTPQFSRNLED